MKADPHAAITVVGSINVDFSVTAERLPKPGESVVGNEFFQAFGGKGANQAVGISRLTSRPVRFVAAVGDDDLGRSGLESLKQNNIDTQFVRIVKGVNSGIALIMIDAQGENCIVAAPGANAYVDPGYVESMPEDLFRNSVLVVLCQEIPVESLEVIVNQCQRFDVPVLFNPAPPNPRLTQTKVLEQVHYLTPNETESAAITGLPVETMNDLQGRLKVMENLASKSCASIAMTLGQSGCCVFDREKMDRPDQSVMVDAPSVQAVDTTAAGDSFNAALAVAITEGKGFEQACAWANRCARSVLQKGCPAVVTQKT